MSRNLTAEELQETMEALENNPTVTKAAEALGISRGALWHRQQRALSFEGVASISRLQDDSPTNKVVLPKELPSTKIPLKELLERRRAEWTRIHEAKEAHKLIPIQILDDKPIALAVFGDLHLDDAGCNFPLLEEHTKIVRETEGMYAGAVGDLQNAWTFRLARLWGEQTTTAAEAWMLVEWWIRTMGDDLLWIVEGNHDAWASGVNGVTPIEWIKRDRSFLSQPDGLCFDLQLGTGPVGEKTSITINCRHDFKGRSQYNPAHGPAKAAWFGMRYDILLAGHTHQAGYTPLKDPLTGRVNHAVRVASYKHHDSYADRLGFRDENLFECPVFIIDPREEPRHQVTMLPNPKLASRVITMLRQDA